MGSIHKVPSILTMDVNKDSEASEVGDLQRFVLPLVRSCYHSTSLQVHHLVVLCHIVYIAEQVLYTCAHTACRVLKKHVSICVFGFPSFLGFLKVLTHSLKAHLDPPSKTFLSMNMGFVVFDFHI